MTVTVSASSPGRDRERNRKLAAGVVTAVLSRGSGALVPVVLIPVTLGYLGADLYGLWMAVTALVGMAAFADLGLGNGLMTKLAPCCATGDSDRAARLVSSSYALLAGMALAATSLLWLVADVVPWATIVNLGGSATASDARTMALVCLTAFIVNVPLSLVGRVQYAYQQVGQSNVWLAVGNLSALPLALAAVHADLGAAPVAAATVVGPVLTNVVNSLWVYGRRMPELRPRLRLVDGRLARELLRLGGLFFALTIVISLASNADALIIANTQDLRSTAEYAVPAKLVAQLGVLVYMLSVPLWPANGDALALGHVGWVRRTTTRMTRLCVLGAALPAVLLVVLGDRLFDVWLDEPLDGGRPLLVGLVAWMVLMAAVSPRFMVQNAAGVIRPQLVGWALYLALSVVGKWYAARWYGITAVPYVAVAVAAVTVVPAALHGYRVALTRAESRTEEVIRDARPGVGLSPGAGGG